MLTLSAEARWDWPADASEDNTRVRLANASVLVQFIDETYGAEGSCVSSARCALPNR